MTKLKLGFIVALVALPLGVFAGGAADAKITEAQEASEFDLGGHAAKAKVKVKVIKIIKVKDAIVLAAETANEEK